MDKKKPIMIGMTGLGALTAGAYQLVKMVYSGSRFLDSYLNQYDYDLVKMNSNVKLEEDG